MNPHLTTGYRFVMKPKPSSWWRRILRWLKYGRTPVVIGRDGRVIGKIRSRH